MVKTMLLATSVSFCCAEATRDYILRQMPTVNREWLTMVTNARIKEGNFFSVTGHTDAGSGHLEVRDREGHLLFTVEKR